ncbi:ATP-binding protein [Lentzea sp. NBRC 105346]|uniref:ATP-binding protein n=1 Tax=Lentzea sp. NBRC 105346 TaxID=3032205 RepID=UPI0025522138|nr:ATP-binding protein [Lentzea sp. NBRC 105346]
MSIQGEFSVARDAGGVGLAREFAHMFLTRSGYTGSREDVILVASELVANALQHGDVVLRIAGDASRVRIEVTGAGERRHGGWGMKLIAALSTVWGVDDRDTGKVLWSELRAMPGDVLVTET